jgi:hypothetical protein
LLVLDDDFDPQQDGSVDGIETRGARLLEAIARHATHLSLPEGCSNLEDVLPAELRDRLRQPAMLAAQRWDAAQEEEPVLVRRDGARRQSAAKTRT